MSKIRQERRKYRQGDISEYGDPSKHVIEGTGYLVPQEIEGAVNGK